MKPDQANEQRAAGGAQAPRGSRSSPEGSPAPQEQYRIVISREANAQVEKCIAKACQGFDPGALTRTDLANYVFCNLAKILTDADYKALRALHFDEKKVLGSILKSEGELPEEIRKALRDFYGLAEPAKKRALRAAPEASSDALVESPPAA